MRNSRASLSALHDDLASVIIAGLDANDLCRLSGTSQRFRFLTACEDLWLQRWTERWGEPSKLQHRAAALAGGLKALFGSKARTDRTSAPWTRPAPEELRASVEALARRVRDELQQVATVFLIDGSGSVNAEEFDAMLGFVMEASTQLKEAVPDCQVAVVQFSNDVRCEAALAPVDLEALRKCTREMVRMNGGTNVAAAVQKAGQLLKRDAAPDAMRHVVLITDGRVDSYQAHEARQMAEQLADEQRHVSLFAYAVGRGVDRAELLHIIGGPPTCAHVVNQLAAAAAARPSGGGAAGGGGGGDAGGAAGEAAGAAAAAAAGRAAGGGFSLSAWGAVPEDRYLALCVRDEAPW